MEPHSHVDQRRQKNEGNPDVSVANPLYVPPLVFSPLRSPHLGELNRMRTALRPV